MSKRLVKIAKELNVGTSTIVQHLIESGFEIENKPTAKVSDEMYANLVDKFSKSKAEKEKADLLVIGQRTQEAEVLENVVVPPPPPAPVEKVEEKIVEEVPVEAPKPVVEKVEAKVVEEVEAKVAVEEKLPPTPAPEEKPVVEEVIRAKKPESKIKVVGKIDLDKGDSKKKDKEPVTKEAAKKKQEKPVVKEEKVAAKKETAPKKEATKKKEAKKETKKEEKPAVESKKAPEAVPEVLMRAKTPQLQGLKIMGKVDASKLSEPKKKKPEVKKPAASGAGGDRPKRKRTRKKITADVYMRGRRSPGNSGNNKGSARKDEVKEVSKKEIEEKIKATMARISGAGKKQRQKNRRGSRELKREKQEAREVVQESGILELTEFISVSELASLMNVSASEVIMTCMNLGVIVSINQRLDAEIIELVGGEFGHEVKFIQTEEQKDEEDEIIDDPEDLEERAPIVTVMGHVDHGKTSLLDYIRSATVAEGEAGGITQHIGAYEVVVNGKKITFLDTPGHEAFTAMRARGAKVTDVVIIIVAADDNIMPQTKEAISHAQAAGVPIIFAINKIDKDGANPEKIKQSLASMNFLVEDWGGKYQSQDISAKAGTNIDALLEKILLESEVLELKANPKRLAIGTVIEASLDKGRGYVTKLLVQNGTLKVGDALVAGGHAGKIKAMFNEKGKRIKVAGPSTPVLVLGMNGAPQAGEKFKILETEQEAKQIASKRMQIIREQTNRASKRISLDEIGRRLALGDFKELNLIVKGDVDGSIEALADSLIKLSIDKVQVNVIHKAVGQIIESDVLLASASEAIIIGFQVRPSMGARNLAEKEGIQIKTYSIIYEAIEEVKMAIEGMLEPTKEEKIVCQIDVREVYKISRIGTIAGCYVQEGLVTRNTKIRLIRDGIVIYPTKEGVKGELSSLKRFKDDAKEVKSGLECGLTIKNYNDIKVGDVVEGYDIIEIKQKYEK